MSAEVITEAIGDTSAPRRRRGRWFFAGLAIAIACTVLVGFARTYYLKELFPPLSLPTVIHVHGALFTAWILLFVSQTFLIAHRRVSVHRRLGVISALLVIPMLVTGVFVAIEAAKGEGLLRAAVARGELALALPQIPPLVGLAIPLTSVVLIAAFVSCGLAYRRRPDTHKRFMALAAVAMSLPALVRAQLVIMGTANPALPFAAIILLLAAIAIHDRRTRGHVHPVTLWGGLLIVVSLPARVALGYTQLWLVFASWLTSSG